MTWIKITHTHTHSHLHSDSPSAPPFFLSSLSSLSPLSFSLLPSGGVACRLCLAVLAPPPGDHSASTTRFFCGLSSTRSRSRRSPWEPRVACGGWAGAAPPGPLWGLPCLGASRPRTGGGGDGATGGGLGWGACRGFSSVSCRVLNCIF